MASDQSPNIMLNINNTITNLDFNTPQNDAVLNDPDENDEVDVDDDEYSNSSPDRPPPLPSAAPNRPIPAAAPPTSLNTAVYALPAKLPAPTPPYPIDESRKLFQRLWTDEDEIELLQGFLEYNHQRQSNNQHHHDTTAFYDQIKRKLQLEFNRNQLVEKLRRLKKKFRNVVQKIESGKEYVFKSPHDQATFEISKKIWGGIAGITPRISQSPDDGGLNDEDEANVSFSPNSIGVDEKIHVRPKKRARVIDQVAPVVVTGNVIEETMRSCLLPIFKELLNGVVSLSNGGQGVGGLAGLVSMPFGLGFGGVGNGGANLGDAADEKWRKQNILELEVFSKRLELVQEQIKAQLEELRTKLS